MLSLFCISILLYPPLDLTGIERCLFNHEAAAHQHAQLFVQRNEVGTTARIRDPFGSFTRLRLLTFAMSSLISSRNNCNWPSARRQTAWPSCKSSRRRSCRPVKACLQLSKQPLLPVWRLWAHLVFCHCGHILATFLCPSPSPVREAKAQTDACFQQAEEQRVRRQSLFSDHPALLLKRSLAIFSPPAEEKTGGA